MEVVIACDERGLIGVGNALPWSFKEDMQHFRRLTTGKRIAMGSATWRSIGSKPLPNRTNYVVSRQPRALPGALCGTLEEAGEQVCVIGGAALLESIAALRTPLTIYLTIVCDWPPTPGTTLGPAFLQLLSTTTTIASRCIIARDRATKRFHHLQFLQLQHKP